MSIFKFIIILIMAGIIIALGMTILVPSTDVDSLGRIKDISTIS